MVNAQDYVGLSKKSAQNLSEKQGLIFRLIKVDNEEYFTYPEDKRDDRICVEIESNKVIKASIQ